MAATSSLLLDTQSFLWWRASDARLRYAAVERIVDADTVYVSAITGAEIAIKTSIKKLDYPDEDFEAAVRENGFEPLPFDFRHAQTMRDLPLHHRDPFDRMLIAQAIADDLTLVTSDAAMAAYPVRLA